MTREKWEPIETAPKDGTTILAWDTLEHELMFWHNGAWRNNDLDEVPVQPTHWVPGGLPDPPKGFDLFEDDVTGSSPAARTTSTTELVLLRYFPKAIADLVARSQTTEPKP